MNWSKSTFLLLAFIISFFAHSQCNDVYYSDLDGTNGVLLEGSESSSNFGYDAASAGDINGDGINDILVTASVADHPVSGLQNVGSVYVIFGGAGLSSPFAPATLYGTNGFRINGVLEDEYLGTSANTIGDFNNDGIDDLIVGLYGYSDDLGAAMVLYGSTDPFPANVSYADLDGTNGFLIRGEIAGGQFGLESDGLGDVNGDGIPDIIIGAHMSRIDNNSNSGVAEGEKPMCFMEEIILDLLSMLQILMEQMDSLYEVIQAYQIWVIK
ncbi:integrin alpha [Fulvivirga maritima]|uniref:integrin alpha n=1 Tax=Fulvivirga maritima TaxID=2904247 RepID=UPI001F1BA7D9|nr:integrin alpha [Fulvivirga maritima]UII26706.1 integrin alpha [Fulvivirga maritima]